MLNKCYLIEHQTLCGEAVVHTHTLFPQGAQSLRRARDEHRNIPGLCKNKGQSRDWQEYPEKYWLESLQWGRLGAQCRTSNIRCVKEAFTKEVAFALAFDGCVGFTDSSVDKESACKARDPGLIPGLGRSPGEGLGYTLQYSWASLVAQWVKNPSAKRETWV